MFCFILIFIVADIYGQPPLNNAPFNNAPSKINENIPKEKPNQLLRA